MTVVVVTLIVEFPVTCGVVVVVTGVPVVFVCNSRFVVVVTVVAVVTIGGGGGGGGGCGTTTWSNGSAVGAGYSSSDSSVLSFSLSNSAEPLSCARAPF